jgi:outer membrane protein TolC
MNYKLICFFLLTQGTALAAITPKSVAQSTLNYHPNVRAALESLRAAEDDLRASRGGFDTVLNSDFRRQTKGDWRMEISRTTLEKPLPFAQSKVYVGQEYIQPNARGFLSPIYNTNHPTTQQGNFQMLGAKFSLWRNLLTDPRRARMEQAGLDVKIAKGTRQLAEIELVRLGQLAYWDWVKARHVNRIYEELLNNGLRRNDLLLSRVKRGDLAQIVYTENEQYVAARQGALQEAKAGLIQATQNLSLFLRDETGVPVVVDEKAEFEDFPKNLDDLLASVNLRTDLDNLRRRRADLANLDLAVRKQQTDLELARQDLKPQLDLTTEYFQRTEANSTMPRDYLMVLAQISIPIERRLGQGKIAAASARKRVAEEEKRIGEERFIAEVTSLQRSLPLRLERVRQSQIEVDKAQELVETETFKFKSGGGSLFLVNLREEAVANAAAIAVEARLAFLDTLLTYQALITENEL